MALICFLKPATSRSVNVESARKRLVTEFCGIFFPQMAPEVIAAGLGLLLTEWVQPAPPTALAASNFGQQLAELHKHGQHHGDLRPSKLLFTADQVKLAGPSTRNGKPDDDLLAITNNSKIPYRNEILAAYRETLSTQVDLYQIPNLVMSAKLRKRIQEAI